MAQIGPLEKLALEYLERFSTIIFTCAVVYSITFGVHLALFGLAAIPIYYRIVRSDRKLPSIALFSAVFLSLVTAIIDTIAQIVVLVITIQTTLIEDVEQGIVAYDASELKVQTLATTFSLLNWALVAQPIINDSIVIWRAWVLFPRKRWIMSFPILLLLCTIGTSLAFFFGMMEPSNYAEGYKGNSPILFYGLSAIFSLSTNVISTLFICYKLWAFNRISQPLAKTRVSGSKSSINRILAILVESGLVYCVFQVACVVTNSTLYLDDNRRWRYYIFRSLAGPLSEIYPALVVCLVHYRRTSVDTNLEPVTSITSRLRQIPQPRSI